MECRLVDLARDEALDGVQMRAAATIGQFVKDQPTQEMKVLVRNLPWAEKTQVELLCCAGQTTDAGCCG